MVKKTYNKPELKLIGNMVENTLGSSGTGADGGTFQEEGGGNGNQASTNSFNNNTFNNSGF